MDNKIMKSLKDAVLIGNRLFMESRYDEAKMVYKKVLITNPHHSVALHNLGMVFFKNDNVQESVSFFVKALNEDPSVLQYWLSLADAYLNLEEFKNATKLILRSIEHQKFSKQLLQLIAAKVLQDKNITAPVQKLNFLQNKLDCCEYNDILIEIENIISLYSTSPKIENFRGAAYFGLEKYEKASLAFEQAILLNPSYADAYNNLGNVKLKLHKFKEAIICYHYAIAIASAQPEYYFNLGIAHAKNRSFDAAITNFESAVKLQPNYPAAYNNLGIAFQSMGNNFSAIKSYQYALQYEPKNAETYINLGLAYKELGDADEAKNCINKAIELDPCCSSAYRQLSLLVDFAQSPEQIPVLNELAAKASNTNEDSCNYFFALAKAYEDTCNFSKAAAMYNKANSLRKSILKYNIAVDKERFRRVHAINIELAKLKPVLPSYEQNHVPIFIVGMPRSGTTLVEQILSNHEEISGAGELFFIDEECAKFIHESKSVCNQDLLNIRDGYFTKLNSLNLSKKFITDKMPRNFLYLSLIRLAIPEARIVHVNRSPLATCWSNFKHYFASNRIGYCYDLKDIASYYQWYRKLMGCELHIGNNEIYQLSYELLTENPQQQIDSLLKYLGLEWDARCLRPDTNVRPVKTASQLQIRRKIYSGSSEAWKNFKPYLEELLWMIDAK